MQTYNILIYLYASFKLVLICKVLCSGDIFCNFLPTYCDVNSALKIIRNL